MGLTKEMYDKRVKSIKRAIEVLHNLEEEGVGDYGSPAFLRTGEATRVLKEVVEWRVGWLADELRDLCGDGEAAAGVSARAEYYVQQIYAALGKYAYKIKRPSETIEDQVESLLTLSYSVEYLNDCIEDAADDAIQKFGSPGRLEQPH